MIENLDDLNREESKKKVNDPRILRARGGDINDPDMSRRPTDPVGLSRSIVHVLRDYEYVNIFDHFE